MPDLLLEVGTEELPARFVEPARVQLEALLDEQLRQQRLPAEALRSWATPRRLAVLARGVPARQPDTEQEVRGPAAAVAFDPQGRPTPAAVGFARSQGVPVDRLQRRSTPAGEYVFARKVLAGRPAREVLGELLPKVVASLSFPKTMRWAHYEVRFARPVRWVVALLDEEVVPFELAGVRAGRWTYGHRQLSPGPHEVPSPSAYEEVLRRAYVLADRAARRAEVVRQVRACAEQAGEPELPDDLVDEVTDLVEWPQAFLGRFDPEFVAGPHALPEPVLVTVMRHHQRYFPVRAPDGRLVGAFVGVRNGDALGLEEVREGNEWVLRARLVDAAFFYREDRKRPLHEWAGRLGAIAYHERLGSMQEKAERLVRLCRWLAGVAHLDPTRASLLERAASLCKADLATHLVGEFPELQGVVGAIYARLDGEDPQVCEALEDHYRPRGAADGPPRTLLGALLAAADRADTLAGFVGAGMVPTGSSDPYGLRRAAWGLLEALCALHPHAQVPLGSLVDQALRGYGDRPDFDRASQRLAAFLADRVRAYCLERGLPYDVVDAVLALWPHEVPDFLDALRRSEALWEFRKGPRFGDAYEAFDRAYRIWDKRTRTSASPPTHQAEQALDRATADLTEEVQDLVARGAYGQALAALARLQAPVAALFDAVLVNDPDPEVRAGRHALLGRVVDLFWKVAHLEHLVVSREG